MTLRTFLTSFRFVVLTLLCSPVIAATDWIAEMPKPADVAAKIQGSDPADTAARQRAAFEILNKIRDDRIGIRRFRNEVTPAEKQLAMNYVAEMTRVEQTFIASLPPAERTGANSQRAKWFGLTRHYEFDAPFNADVLAMFFSKGFQAELADIRRRDASDAKARQAALARQATDNAARFDAATRDPSASTPREAIERAVPAQWRWATNPWLWCGVFGALFAFGVFRAAGRFGLDADDILTLHVGARRYVLHRASGLVTDLQRWSEATTVPTSQTVTHHDGSQSTIRGTSTRVDNGIQIMLRDAGGHTQAIQLWNLDLAVAPGQGFAAVWAIRKGKREGPYVMLHNRDLQRTQFIEDALLGTVKMPFWPAWALGAMLLCTGLPWWVAVGAFVAYGVVAAIVSRLRARRFKKDFAPQLVAALPTPPEGIVLPGGGMLSPG